MANRNFRELLPCFGGEVSPIQRPDFSQDWSLRLRVQISSFASLFQRSRAKLGAEGALHGRNPLSGPKAAVHSAPLGARKARSGTGSSVFRTALGAPGVQETEALNEVRTASVQLFVSFFARGVFGHCLLVGAVARGCEKFSESCALTL